MFLPTSDSFCLIASLVLTDLTDNIDQWPLDFKGGMHDFSLMLLHEKLVSVSILVN